MTRFFLPTLAGTLCALLFLIVPVATDAHGQDAASKQALHDAFAAGDAKATLASATERVQLNLPGGGSQYSRSQAIYVLQQFFDTHPPRRFAWRSTSAGERSRFLTGRYWQEGAEEALSVHLRLTKAQGAWRLQEIRIQQP